MGFFFPLLSLLILFLFLILFRLPELFLQPPLGSSSPPLGHRSLARPVLNSKSLAAFCHRTEPIPCFSVGSAVGCERHHLHLHPHLHFHLPHRACTQPLITMTTEWAENRMWGRGNDNEGERAAMLPLGFIFSFPRRGPSSHVTLHAVFICSFFLPGSHPSFLSHTSCRSGALKLTASCRRSHLISRK